jgi:hypothetical protein
LIEFDPSVNQDREVVLEYLGDYTSSCHVESVQLHRGGPPEMLYGVGLSLAINILNLNLRPVL